VAAPIRTEHDLLGDRAVPGDAYYGVHTLRALENFPITGTPISIYPDLVMALACVKQAAAIANSELGLIDERRAHAIRLACEEVREGKLFDEFVVDVIQGGAGTSSNMNANEVICNRALELLGHRKGEYQHLHPLDHVNLSQSTNDVYPTAVKLALQFGIQRLLQDMALLRKAFDAKPKKLGRTAFISAADYQAYQATLTAGPGAWSALGPVNTDIPGESGQFFDPLTQTGPSTSESGRVTALAIDPNCGKASAPAGAPCRLWVAAAGGGIWRTNDAMAGTPAWIAPPDSLPTNSFGSLTVDPNDASGNPLPHAYGWFVQNYNGGRVAWHHGVSDNASSSMIITLPQRGITLILLANSPGLVRPFDLSAGDVTVSPFARLFLSVFVR